jgi:hypothetical protein
MGRDLVGLGIENGLGLDRYREKLVEEGNSLYAWRVRKRERANKSCLLFLFLTTFLARALVFPATYNIYTRLIPSMT